MPTLWQSSQRPMYVRTVWVDGFRHAILSHDDPYFLNAKKRRPHSSATCSSKTTISKRSSRTDADYDGSLRNFNFVITNDRTFQKVEPVEKLNLSEVDTEADELVVRANPQGIYDFDSCRSKLNSIVNMRTVKSNRTARSDVKENTELSERVLQWLDLAGKVDLLAPDNVERMSQSRHSWPEIQRRNNLMKSKTAIDVRKESANAPVRVLDSAKTQESGAIDRADFYVPTSASTIENYARLSRNARSTPRHDARNDNKIKPRDIRSNIAETRQKVVSERNAVEKQYAELISKKLIPGVNNNRKQVHIFMPELPKKFPSATTSRAESLLSHISQLSQMSKASLKSKQ